MKTIGLIGGMSWESTAEYYRIINQEVRARLGGLHSARSVMVSVDFAEIEAMQAEARWDEAGEALADAARQLDAAGADFALICTNTMHKVYDAVAAAVDIPVLHLADATAGRVVKAGIESVGLLGTAFTMEQAFYIQRLEAAGLNVIVPERSDRTIVHQVIYDELCMGIVLDDSRAEYDRIIQQLVSRGAQGVILGCTEIELLVNPDADGPVPYFPTSRIHAEAAVDWALAE